MSTPNFTDSLALLAPRAVFLLGLTLAWVSGATVYTTPPSTPPTTPHPTPPSTPHPTPPSTPPPHATDDLAIMAALQAMRTFDNLMQERLEFEVRSSRNRANHSHAQIAKPTAQPTAQPTVGPSSFSQLDNNNDNNEVAGTMVPTPTARPYNTNHKVIAGVPMPSDVTALRNDVTAEPSDIIAQLSDIKGRGGNSFELSQSESRSQSDSAALSIRLTHLATPSATAMRTSSILSPQPYGEPSATHSQNTENKNATDTLQQLVSSDVRQSTSTRSSNSIAASSYRGVKPPYRETNIVAGVQTQTTTGLKRPPKARLGCSLLRRALSNARIGRIPALLFLSYSCQDGRRVRVSSSLR